MQMIEKTMDEKTPNMMMGNRLFGSIDEKKEEKHKECSVLMKRWKLPIRTSQEHITKKDIAKQLMKLMKIGKCLMLKRKF